MGSRALASHPPGDGLFSHLDSCKAVGGLATVGTPQRPLFKRGGWIEQVTRMASVLAALARISNPHRRIHTAATFRSVDGLIGPPPTRPGLRAWSRLVLTTGLGLWLGAVMSRNMAQILEENELFVPSDDDDDD